VPAEAARRAQDQAEGEVGDAAGGDVGRMGDRKSPRPRRRDIGMVEEAAGRRRDPYMIRQRGHERRIELEGRGEEDRVGLMGLHKLQGLVGRELAVFIGDLEHLPRALDHRQVGAADER